MQDNRTLRLSALLVTTVSSFLTPFMGSSIDLALKSISQDLKADAVSTTWVQLTYLLISVALVVPFGRAGDLYGRKRVYLIGLAVYGIGSALAATAPTVGLLIAFRALQGVGGAMVFGTAVATLTSIFGPAERGRVLGINTAAVYTGLSLGPALGGMLTHYLGWRSIFVLSGVLALAALLLALAMLRGEWAGAAGESFDWVGALLYSAALIALLYGLSEIYETPYARWLALGGLLGLGGFFFREMAAQHPVLDLRRFRGNIPFIFSNLAALIHYSATFSIGLLLSLYLQVVRGMPAQQAGLVLLAQPVTMTVLSPISGRLSDRVQPRLLASLGMALMAAGLFALSTLRADTPLAVLVGMSFLIGFGYGLFSAPNTNAVMGSVEVRDYGVASSTLATVRLVGQTLSMTIALLLFSIYLGRVEIDPQIAAGLASDLLQAVWVAFRLFTGLCLVGMVASLARGKVRRQTDGGF